MPFEIALELRKFRIVAIPLRPKSKLPVESWKQFRFEIPEPSRLIELFPIDRPDLNVGALCGAASDRLVVIDCDNEESFRKMIDRFDNPNTWLVKSHRGGHIYLRTAVAIRSGKAAGVEIKGEGNYVLAPGSLHPKGMRYEFLRRSACILELNTLSPIPGLVFEPAPVKPKGFPSNAWQLLTGGQATRPYSSRSEKECAVCASLINHGFDFESVLRIFVDHADHGSKFAQLNNADASNARRYLLRTYDSAARFVETNISKERAFVRMLRENALAMAWTGQSGLSDRATYLAHLDIADKCGKLVYGASVRELAELAGITTPTISQANKRLVTNGLLQVEKGHTLLLSKVWRLLPQPIQRVHSLHTLLTSPPVRECIKLVPRHDAFRWRGGKSIEMIWQVLNQSAKPISKRKIAKITGRHKQTINRALNWMSAQGMIEHEEDGWVAVKNVDLNAMARKIGTYGKAERQKIQHTRERRHHQTQIRGMIPKARNTPIA